MADLSKVKVPRKQAMEILETMRPILVQHLVDGMSREQANAVTAEQLRASDNILSPYATEVIEALVVTDEEIKKILSEKD